MVAAYQFYVKGFHQIPSHRKPALQSGTDLKALQLPLGHSDWQVVD
jgi:hypothetical protein